ncbi:unnamed protein product [Protopolystoma xenopodis]|uniref:Uncharacterized protein n=1 Tax=Protopolystoma xenopodis TaxID=117903 RepID=A0A3S5A8W1_9PLAT|nr:unnamed protein product [Protopolystoma xenopodis]
MLCRIWKPWGSTTAPPGPVSVPSIDLQLSVVDQQGAPVSRIGEATPVRLNARLVDTTGRKFQNVPSVICPDW